MVTAATAQVRSHAKTEQNCRITDHATSEHVVVETTARGGKGGEKHQQETAEQFLRCPDYL